MADQAAEPKTEEPAAATPSSKTTEALNLDVKSADDEGKKVDAPLTTQSAPGGMTVPDSPAESEIGDNVDMREVFVRPPSEPESVEEEQTEEAKEEIHEIHPATAEEEYRLAQKAKLAKSENNRKQELRQADRKGNNRGFAKIRSPAEAAAAYEAERLERERRGSGSVEGEHNASAPPSEGYHRRVGVQSWDLNSAGSSF